MKKLITLLTVIFIATTTMAVQMWIYPNGTLRPRLPKTLPTENGVIFNAPQEMYEAAGYRLETPEDAEERERREQENQVMIYSKYKLCLALDKRNKMSDFQDWLSSSGYEFLWTAAQDLATDNQLFQRAKTALSTVLQLTDEEVEEILQESEF